MADYHWSGAVQRAFLEALAETGSVQLACDACGKSRRAAYNLRQRAEGHLFAIGWDAAMRLARDVVFDTLMDRAILGQWVETVRDKDASSTRRHSWDRRLGMDLLSRLDRMIEASTTRTSPAMAATIAAHDFGAFLDLVESGDLAAANAFFVGRMGDCRFGFYTPTDPLFVAAEVKAAPARAKLHKMAAKRRKATPPPSQLKLGRPVRGGLAVVTAMEELGVTLETPPHYGEVADDAPAPADGGVGTAPVTPDLFRDDPAHPPRVQEESWTPDHVRGDEDGVDAVAEITSIYCELPQNSAPSEAPADHPTLVPDRPRRMITAPRVVPAIGTRAYANWVRGNIPQW